jgi:hypothetical protein
MLAGLQVLARQRRLFHRRGDDAKVDARLGQKLAPPG